MGVPSGAGFLSLDFLSRRAYNVSLTFEEETMKKQLLMGILILGLAAFWGCAKKTVSSPIGGGNQGGNQGGGNAPIALTSPKGGENWIKGSTHSILWTSSGLSSGVLQVDFSKDGGATWDTLATGLALTVRSFSWVPQDTTHRGLVRVSNVSGSQILARDSSHAFFTISPAPNIPYTVASVAVDSGPYGVAITPDGSNAYVTCSGAGKVDVISTANNSVVAHIAVGSQPRGVAISPNGAFAYVANNQDGTISVISTSTRSVTATIPTQGYPTGVAISPDGHLIFVVHSNSDYLSVIDAATNAVRLAISGGGRGEGIAARPTGRFVFSTKSTGSVFGVLDTLGFVFTGYPLNGKIGSSGIAFLPSGAQAYIANTTTNNISVVDASTNQEVATLTDPSFSFPTGVAAVPNGNYVYVSQKTSSILTAISTGSSHTVVGPIAVDSAPIGLAVTPNGQYVYVACSGLNTVSVVFTNGF